MHGCIYLDNLAEVIWLFWLGKFFFVWSFFFFVVFVVVGISWTKRHWWIIGKSVCIVGKMYWFASLSSIQKKNHFFFWFFFINCFFFSYNSWLIDRWNCGKSMKVCCVSSNKTLKTCCRCCLARCSVRAKNIGIRTSSVHALWSPTFTFCLPICRSVRSEAYSVMRHLMMINRVIFMAVSVFCFRIYIFIYLFIVLVWFVENSVLKNIKWVWKKSLNDAREPLPLVFAYVFIYFFDFFFYKKCFLKCSINLN